MTLADSLSQLAGEYYLDDVTRSIYATDASHYQQIPQCVVIPKHRDDILAALAIAKEHNMPITARGGGTSLSGQTFGPGMVIDTSKYCNRVLSIDPEAQTAVVEPGVIRDQLNASLAEHGLHFAPDPATGSRASIGGMIGNNTSGTRSIVYGKTIDHVLGCTVALTDGTILTCTDHDRLSWQQIAQQDDREGAIYSAIDTLIDKHVNHIRDRYPRVLRRVSGYNLDEFVNGAGYIGSIGPRGDRDDCQRPWNLSNLIVGSEGTLGFLLDATIRLTPSPQATCLCIVHFDDDLAALRAAPLINGFQPSAVELLDKIVLDEARVNPATKDMATFIEGDPAAILIVEFFGNTAADCHEKAQACAAKLAQSGCGYAWPIQNETSKQKDIWDVRKLGLGLISNTPGPCKGQAFVEDACVPVEDLADYIGGLQEACNTRNVAHSMYAHASVGVIHFRPMLDLHQADDRQKMAEIAEYSFTECTKRGGTVAGEHGDGIVRGQFIERAFGPELYQAFKDLKNIFDPDGLFNPGKLIDSPSLIDSSLLRYGDHYQSSSYQSAFHFHEQQGLQLAVEQCNGVGACRKLNAGTMCPSFMALGDEAHSTRGRANALRMALSGQLKSSGDEALASDALHEILDLCLSCKACASECPNGVDMAKLKAEALHCRNTSKGTPLSARLIGMLPDIARRFPLALRLYNVALGLPGGTSVLQKLSGTDSRRPLPKWSNRSLRQLTRNRSSSQQASSSNHNNSKRVGLFVDTYTGHMAPHIGQRAIQLLEQAGWHVDVLHAGCCQRPRLSQGLLSEASTHGLRTLQNLNAYADAHTDIIVLEPSCASSLSHDLVDLVEDRACAQRVADRILSIENFFNKHDIRVRSTQANLSIHTHCHQNAVGNTAGMTEIDDCTIDASGLGCCGMAGAFGYQHYDVSMKVAEDRFLPAMRKAQKNGNTIVTNGISCRHQLHDSIGVDAKHWVEVVELIDGATDG